MAISLCIASLNLGTLWDYVLELDCIDTWSHENCARLVHITTPYHLWVSSNIVSKVLNPIFRVVVVRRRVTLLKK